MTNDEGDPPTLGGTRPGCARAPRPDTLVWAPCLSRAEGGREHVWFLAPSGRGSFYCWECSVGRPRVFVGPREIVAEIREAMEGGDLELAKRLVERARAARGDRDPKPENVIVFQPRDLADWQEFFTERAAIAEYVGGMPRAQAEQQAHALAGPAPRRAA